MELIKKSFIFVFVLMASLVTLLAMPNKSSAADEGILEKPVNFGVELQVSDEVNPAFVNPYRYSKENVKTSYSWSSYKRVSDNIKTGSKGGSITATKTVSFKTEISGPVYGHRCWGRQN